MFFDDSYVFTFLIKLILETSVFLSLNCMFLIPLTGIDSRWLFVPNNTLTSDFGTWCCTLPSFSSAILFKTRLKFPWGKSTVKDFGCSFGCHFFQCFQQFILFNRLKAWHQPQCLSIVSVNLADHCYFFTLLCSSSSILLTISGQSFASTLEWHFRVSFPF